MNRYPVWKYVIIVIAMLLGAVYTLPNFFGEAPAVQVSSGKATVKVDTSTLQKVEETLKAAGLSPQMVQFDGNSIRARFDTPDNQLKAKDAIEKALIPDTSNPSYVVALNLVTRSPAWLGSLRAAPMYLGLDLRGGVHFMLQVVEMHSHLSELIENQQQAENEQKEQGEGFDIAFVPANSSVYNPDTSHTFKVVPKQSFKLDYADNTHLKGFQANDVVQLGDYYDFANFGAVTDCNSPDFNDVDGIVGFGMPSPAAPAPPPAASSSIKPGMGPAGAPPPRTQPRSRIHI
jgi:hypothetical protein